MWLLTSAFCAFLRLGFEDPEEVVIRREQQNCAGDDSAEQQLKCAPWRGGREDPDVWFNQMWILSEGPAEENQRDLAGSEDSREFVASRQKRCECADGEERGNEVKTQRPPRTANAGANCWRAAARQDEDC